MRALDGGPADPKYCVKAPPITTNNGNCTTHVEAFFSDANATLRTQTMQSCGILTWLPVNPDGGGHAYKEWAIERAEHYRLLNDPAQAESVCLDVLAVDPDNQHCLTVLLLALTDQFAEGAHGGEKSVAVLRSSGSARLGRTLVGH